ncbi:HupE/UreJ family protein [Thermoactinomyces mirandus]|uniref:HupE/UreJ family protein n=1 Tax=Thermoactinomyces mirandus TaxID=2756294 RepID=A0A7W1XSA8_9BACL|nr:HupE/UreJ family protein [Thermoactinomyces mirandus]MBA4602216.1 HupE/UreJ family protein [Thermoactinomyces mirandus]
MKRAKWWGLVFVIFFGVFLTAPVVQAHPLFSVATDLKVGENEIEMSLLINDALLKKVPGEDLSVENGLSGKKKQEIGNYIKKGFVVKNNGRPMTGRIEEIARPDLSHVRVKIRFTSQQKVEKVDLFYSMFFEIDKSRHQNIVTIHDDGKESRFVFHDSERHLSFTKESRLSIWLTVRQFIQIGMEHIWFGFDHLAFLAALFVAGGGWKHLLKVITSFTIAHSITLFLAVMDIVAVPSKWVEALIALTIVYVAVENQWFRSPEHRPTVTFFFGLIHGLGFAGSLSEIQLPKDSFLAALFSFNLGVELGQIVIFLCLIPVSLLLKRLVQGRWLVQGVSGIIALFGIFWFVERVFELEIPFFPL